METVIIAFTFLQSYVILKGNLEFHETPKGLVCICYTKLSYCLFNRLRFRITGVHVLLCLSRSVLDIYLGDFVVLIGVIDIVLGEVDK
jgi:NADH:ubiquinone oxidoreductase subunit D